MRLFSPCRSCPRASQLAVRCSGKYEATLFQAEQAADSLKALEILTEVRVLGIDLPPPAIEAGIRALTASSASRAYDLLQERLLSKNVAPSVEDTLVPLFRALAEVGEASKALELLLSTEGDLLKHASRDKLVNSVIRCLVKVDLDQAVAKTETYRKLGVGIESGTYSQLAAKSLLEGNFELAEQMLEERDYL